MLLPSLATTLRAIREAQDYSLRKMADRLSETAERPRLVRGTSVGSLYSNMSRVERAIHWPRDPDAWVAAYASVANRCPDDVWAEVIGRWTDG